MNIFRNTPFKTPLVLKLALAASLALPLPAVTAPLTLATAPLASATTTQVLPNLMFILDDSGSMDSDYAPDSVNGAIMPLFKNAAYNGMYYTPAVRYLPPAYFTSSGLDTTTYPSQTGINLASGADTSFGVPNWRKVKRDAYGVQTSSSLLSDGTIDNLEGTASYYTFVAGEYCEKVDLKTCVTASAPSASYPFPAPLRWCNSAANAAAATPAANSCQAVQVGSFTFARYPAQYQATIRIFIASGTAVAGATVNGQQIMSSATPGGTTNTTTIASSIATRINACTTVLTGNCTALGFSASSSGDAVTVFAPSVMTFTPVVTTGFSPGSVATITLTSASSTPRANGITVNGQQIMSGQTSSSNSLTTLADAIRDAINNCTSAATGNCTVSGYRASSSGGIVTIIGPAGLTFTPSMTTSSGTLNFTTAAFAATSGISLTAFGAGSSVPGVELFTAIVPSINSYVYGNTAAKAAARADCAGTTCTYVEEMTNYANWWTYYRTRMQAMKTSAAIAFRPIDTRYRVGYSTISYTGTTDGTEFYNVSLFNSANKSTWYGKVFAAVPSGSTPLRGALSKAGRYFAKKVPGQATDPIQYSCQQNFALLTTDGYWNMGLETSSYKNLNLAGGLIGDMDGSGVPRPMYEGPTASAGSLADIAKYYYDTDLRTSALGNCTGALGGAIDVCEDNVFVSGTDNNVKQHMTTFTLGLGLVGNLQYTGDYKTATSGDFYNLKNGLGSPTVNWPDPEVTNTGNTVVSRVDDLWHAAVNGQGTYFSARDPTELTNGLSAALAAINSKIGAGAAAATSTLNPVAGDNFAYVASYTTVKWTGNLEARSINILTGVVAEDASWCVEDVVAASCPAPSSIVATTIGASTIYNCETPSSDASTCLSPAILDGTVCKLEVPTACIGTMRPKVSTGSDTRNIYTKVGAGLGAFNYTNLTGSQKAYFDTAFLAANLSQWGVLTGTQQGLAVGDNFVNFLRGQNGFEDRDSNVADNRLFRFRESVMADALESKPAYIAKPVFSYLDPGYSAFKTAQASRAGTVYIGTNDGMLHAFNAVTGAERWAYVPSMVIPNMWKLADKNYSTMHTNYVNGDSIISDVCTANCTSTASAVWKTILVAGLNGGGKGYFALDITDPDTPVLLWEFDTTTDDDLGYTFGNPEITKKADGTWVVLFTSGYNNTGGSNPGKGFLYVRDAYTGAAISKYSTGVGNAATPSGLSKIRSFTDEAEKNNTATFTYGGDLSGNVWRFDINAPASGSNPLLFARLFSDAAGTVPQPITVRPELGLIDKKRVVFIGTGKYLEVTDLTTTQKQTIYAIQDDDVATTLVNPRTSLVQQTITTAGAIRNVTSTAAVNWSTGRGWYVDLPDSGERQNVAGQLVSGTLLVPTTVPSATVCSPGGYGWLNFLDFKTGGAVTVPATNTVVSSKTNAPIVGINVIYVPKDPGVPEGERKPVVSVVTADKPTPELPAVQPPFKEGGSAFQQKRVIWRELLQ